MHIILIRKSLWVFLLPYIPVPSVEDVPAFHSPPYVVVRVPYAIVGKQAPFVFLCLTLWLTLSHYIIT